MADISSGTKLVDIAAEIQLESEASQSISFIVAWLRGSAIGALNNLIGTTFYIDDVNNTYELNEAPTEAQKSIIKALFEIWQINGMVKSASGSAAYSSVESVSSDGATVKITNRNMINSNLLQLRKQHLDLLNALIKAYLANTITPLAVHGDDCLDFYSNQFNSNFIRGRY